MRTYDEPTERPIMLRLDIPEMGIRNVITICDHAGLVVVSSRGAFNYCLYAEPSWWDGMAEAGLYERGEQHGTA